MTRTTICALLLCVAARAGAIDNIARNGDFEDGLDEWEVRQSEGTVATAEEDFDDSVKGGASASFEIEVSKGVTWHIALFQDNHFLDGGTDYTLAFWAKAELPRPVDFYMELKEAPWTSYGRKSIDLTEEWVEYWSEWTQGPDVPAAWLRIAVGQIGTNFWVDNVRFYEGDYEPDPDVGRAQAVDARAKLATAWGGIKSAR